jgi:hypothetical protein
LLILARPHAVLRAVGDIERADHLAGSAQLIQYDLRGNAKAAVHLGVVKNGRVGAVGRCRHASGGAIGRQLGDPFHDTAGLGVVLDTAEQQVPGPQIGVIIVGAGGWTACEARYDERDCHPGLQNWRAGEDS